MATDQRLSIWLENDLERFVGIIRWEVQLLAEVDSNDALVVSVRGESGLAPIAFSGNQLKQSTQLGVHTHLLPEGKVSIDIRLLSATGHERQSQSQGIVVRPPNALGASVRDKLRRHGTEWAFLGRCDSARYPYAAMANDDPARPWFDRPDAPRMVETLLERGTVSAGEAKILRQFLADGILIVEDAINDELVRRVNEEIDDAIAKKWENYEYGTSQRLNLLHLTYPNIQELWLHPAHRRWVEILFGFPSRPTQTLVYVFGSQQDAHQDTIHLTPFPAGYMCGTWVALQDVVPNSGELVYYPGSHREPRVYLAGLQPGQTIADVIARWGEAAARYSPVTFRPKKGTFAIWHENLLHSGGVRKDLGLERRSVVIHSYADGCIAYADSSGISATAATQEELAARPVPAVVHTERSWLRSALAYGRAMGLERPFQSRQGARSPK